MRKFSHFLLLFYLSTVGSTSLAAERPMIISGFDDVLRQAENTGLLKAALKLLEPDQTFSGMPELYQSLSSESTSPRFYLVSAISNWLEPRIESFLSKTHYPSHQSYLRNWFTQWSIEKFKIQSLREIVEKNPGRKFIVIFDNSNASLDLAKQIHQEFPNQVLAIYLRQVSDKQTPQEATKFYTAYDIALQEYRSSRLSADELSKIAQVIEQEDKREHLIPSYAQCPQNSGNCNDLPNEVALVCEKVRLHIQSLCSNGRN